MLAKLRGGLNTWVARAFFLLLVLAFATWGVGDVVRNIGGTDAGSVATVGGRRVDMAEAQELYRRQLQQVSQMFGGKIEPTPEIKRSVAAQAVERLVTQTALDVDAHDMGLAVSDDAVRRAVYDIPSLHGPDGQFSRANLDTVLRNNGLTEQRFLDLMRADLLQRQLMGAVQAGTTMPDVELRAIFAFQNEKRVAQAVEFPFASVPAPPPPTPEQMQRWYDNHPESFRTPELRRVKAVVLATETVGRDIAVSDDDLKAAWEQQRRQFETPERRSVDVITAPDEAHAADLATAWRAGADWGAIQAASKAAGATTVELNDATKPEFPAAELADAVFGAGPDVVAGPVRGALGYYVVRVTKVVPGTSKTFEQARDAVRARLVAERAADLIDTRANKIDQLLAGGTGLDDLPSDLGLAAVTGTLDAEGKTASGDPAPIPGPPELRTALVQAAFQMKVGDPPRLTQTPADAGSPASYYAVQVEQVTPPAEKPLADVAEQVRADFSRDAVRHIQDGAAAKVLAAVQGGQSLADAATVAGVVVRTLPAVGRSEPVEGVPAPLVTPLFGLKKGEATMIETPDGFMVAVAADITSPDPKADPLGYGQMRDALVRAVNQDVQALYATAVREREKPRVNRNAIDQLAQATE